MTQDHGTSERGGGDGRREGSRRVYTPDVLVSRPSLETSERWVIKPSEKERIVEGGCLITT